MDSERERDPHDPIGQIAERSAELTAKVNLAGERIKGTMLELVFMPNFAQIMPIVRDAVYYSTVNTDALWVEAIKETDGDLLKAWELVEQRRAERREGLESVIEEHRRNSNS